MRLKTLVVDPVRALPTAFFWHRFQRVCVLAFFPSLAAALVGILVGHLLWAAFVPAAIAFGSQLANVGGLIQRKAELEHGYTTIPWLAGEVDLRDPSTGQVLVRAGSVTPDFTTIRSAREFAGEHLPVGSEATQQRPLDEDPDESVRVPDGRLDWLAVIVLIALGLLVMAIVIVGAPLIGGLSAEPSRRVGGLLIGLLIGLVVIPGVLGFASRVVRRRVSRQLQALSRLPGHPLVAPALATVELFGEMSQQIRVRGASNLVLTADLGGVALWSGRRTLTKVCSISAAKIARVEASQARDLRGNVKPAVLIVGNDSQRIHVFIRSTGRWSLGLADGQTIKAEVGQIRSAVATVV